MTGPLRSVVILGAGQAGGRMAQALRAEGYDGAVHLVGDEPYLPYERPPLSKDFMTAGRAADSLSLAPVDQWTQLGVTLHLGKAALSVDTHGRRVALSGGGVLDYDRLVLATGARPRRLPHDHAPIHYLRGIADALALRAELVAGRHLCVIGAGVIGLELAASARALGLRVTVVEQAAAPMVRILPPDLGEAFRSLHEAQGVAFHFGAAATALEQRGGHTLVDLSNGEALEADIVAAGIGVIPNVELLAGAGLDIADGVLTDASGRTADPAIFAVGDVSRPWRALVGRALRLEAWRNAENQPKAAAAALLGQDAVYDEVPWMWSDQYDQNLQVAGLPLEADRCIERRGPDEALRTLLYLRDGVVIGGVTIGAGRDMRPIQQLIARKAVVDPGALADSATPLSVLTKSIAV